MTELTLEEARIARDNLSRQDELNRQIITIESQVLTWMGSAITLHGDVVAGDKPAVLAMRQLLIDKLTAAVSI